MNKVVIMLAVAIVFGMAGIAMAEPIAPGVPWAKSYLEKTGKTAEELNIRMKKTVPDRDEVGVPAYPGSFYYQSNSDSKGRLMSVVLVSTDDPETVRSWYGEHYSGSRKVTVKPFVLYEWMLQMMDLKDMKTEIWIDGK